MATTKLSNSRETFINRITETYLSAQKAKVDANERPIFKMRYEHLDEFYDEFGKIHNKIIGALAADADDEFKVEDAIRKDVDNNYFYTKLVYSELFSAIVSQPSNYVSLPSTNQLDKVRLPKLTIPIFDGNVRDWPTFYDMFRTLVHENTSLADIQKFQYLISFLKDEPLNIIRSIQTNDANYNIAFQTVVSRYQNVRLLATSYWNAINNAPVLKVNSSKELRTLLDIFNENVAALHNLNYPTEQWCFVLFNMLLQRLDSTTKTAFEIEYSKIDLPTYKNLIEFLNNHCKALESVQNMSPQNLNPNKSTKPVSSNNNPVNPKPFSATSSHGRSYPQQTYMANATSSQCEASPNQSNAFSKGSSNSSHRWSSNSKCRLCNQTLHLLSQCSIFLSKSPQERFTYVKQNNACINCLRSSHLLRDCPSTYNCRNCKQRHHTLVHFGSKSENNVQTSHQTYIASSSHLASIPPQNSYVLSQNPSSTTVTMSNPSSNLSQNVDQNTTNTETQALINCSCTASPMHTPKSTILLSTTQVEILDSRGHFQTIRVLLDSGSQANFITQSCLNRLGLTRRKCSAPIIGIDQSSSSTKGITNCTIKPVGQPAPSFTFDVLVLAKLCSNMPSIQFNPKAWKHISNLNLADNTFHIPAAVDMLLGADLFAQILKSGRIPGPPGQPTALETVFGWVLLGEMHQVNESSLVLPSSMESYFTFFEPSIENQLRKFWELENIPSLIHLSPDEKRCEETYTNTLTRDPTGRFIVSLPFRQAEPDLGNTYSLALRCAYSVESRLLKNPDLYNQYSAFMLEYLRNGHMSPVMPNDPRPNHINYLPHHCVLRPDKSTTKIRVVFNASAKGSKGISLNDTLLPGPKLQTDINTILCKFRFHPIVFLADIKQMFLQILLRPAHRDYQRLLWRFDPNKPLQEYRLNTVTFGVTSSPYLAIRTLRELGNLECQNYPKAAQTLLEDIFVDDICSGAASVEAALALQKDLIALLKTGGFSLRKWASNHPQLLSSLPPDEVQGPISFNKEEPLSIKVLGLQWDPSLDTFSFSCQPSEKPCTKRNILSEIARIYDPLGFLSPVSFFAKQLMQKLWLSKSDWDETPEKNVIDVWTQFKIELPFLSNISLPRYIFLNHANRCELHGFADASEAGYAAVVYLRLELSDGSIKTSLLLGKSRVAPLKTQSIPRLELLGATLLANLINFAKETYSKLFSIDEIFAYTDSQVALAWITSSPHRWKSFVANRVSHIQEILPDTSWYHVSSEENPADCASRGLTPKNLVNHPLWFTGPSWLIQSRTDWNFQNFSAKTIRSSDISLTEKRLVFTAVIDDNFLDNICQKYSSLYKIQRFVAYGCRIYYNFRNKNSKNLGSFSAFELQQALLILVKRCQQTQFSEIINQIMNNELLPKPFRKLSPFIDKDGLVRVGGRLRNASIPFEAKHPLLLPRSHRLTELLIEQVHQENLHPGLNTVQYLLRQQFWILSARRAIQSRLSKCIRCFRLRPKSYTPFMGDLPSFRVSKLKCFSHVTLDYAGPLTISMSRHRGNRVLKAYICIFVCCATRAIHIELASDLSSDAFLAAFRRFVARRGRCISIYSDCGTNFVGAYSQLQELSKASTETLNINWHFNPPAAPHFNGLSEAGVKSVKTHLHRVVGDQILTYEEMNTLLIQIEALLNSRPISAQSSDPNDMTPLTPGHFLTLEPLTACPDPDLCHLKLNALSRWQLIQRLNSEFWKRWKTEYLHSLGQRAKWNDPSTKVELNTMVLIQNDNKPPLHWSMGRIVELHPGQDGHVRVVTVRTPNGLLKRPIVKLCPLPIN